MGAELRDVATRDAVGPSVPADDVHRAADRSHAGARRGARDGTFRARVERARAIGHHAGRLQTPRPGRLRLAVAARWRQSGALEGSPRPRPAVRRRVVSVSYATHKRAANTAPKI